MLARNGGTALARRPAPLVYSLAVTEPRSRRSRLTGVGSPARPRSSPSRPLDLGSSGSSARSYPAVLRRRRRDQRLHRRVPRSEPRAFARRRPGAVVLGRPRLQRAPRARRAPACVACCLSAASTSCFSASSCADGSLRACLRPWLMRPSGTRVPQQELLVGLSLPALPDRPSSSGSRESSSGSSTATSGSPFRR